MNNPNSPISEDLIVQLLYTQIQTLSKILHHIESGNPINDYVEENVKNIEKKLRWLRKFYASAY